MLNIETNCEVSKSTLDITDQSSQPIYEIIDTDNSDNSILEANLEEQFLECKKRKLTKDQMYLNSLKLCSNQSDDGQMEGIRDLVRATADTGHIVESQHQNRIRLAFGLILRLFLPLANGVARSIKGIKDVRILRAIKGLSSSRQTLANILAYAANTISMSLSTVQVSHRIDPLLKLMKLRRGECIEYLPEPVSPAPGFQRSISEISPLDALKKPEKCVTIKILTEPPPGTPIRADIILIHGLHGSLPNTWKQGLWNSNGSPVNFQRPPKPPIRPPKRPRHSRANIYVPSHTQKRARIADQEHFLFDQGSVEYLDKCNNCRTECESPDGFPTYRFRKDTKDQPSEALSYTTKKRNKEKYEKDANINAEYSKCWPGDWLPIDCPDVRVIAVNYTTDQYLWRPVWKKKEARTNLIERSKEMTDLLIANKVGCGHPIVWVGHSKGGLFVKQILVDAWESGRAEAEPLWRSAKGAFFYSVPHRGSHLASINPPLLRRSVELIDIEKNSKYLLDLHRRFASLYHLGHLKIEVFSFVETALTLMSVLYLRIVGADSADPGIGDVCGLHLDHREICKPRSRECILYRELTKMINKVC